MAAKETQEMVVTVVMEWVGKPYKKEFYEGSRP
jgi:hypothetical protein